MPPSYMVVDIRWDDYAQDDPSEELVQLQSPTKKINHHHTTPPPQLDRKSFYQNCNLLKTHQRFLLDDQILCWRTSLRSNVEHLAVLKLLITKLTKANRNLKLMPTTGTTGTISTAENHGNTATT